MPMIRKRHIAVMLLTAGLLIGPGGAARAAVRIEGEVQAGGRPLGNSTVTLWAGRSGDPRQRAKAKTASDGSFQLGSQENLGPDASLYLVAQGGGDNPAIEWLSILGNTPSAKVVVNEMTTVASVWTNTQFLNDTQL